MGCLSNVSKKWNVLFKGRQTTTETTSIYFAKKLHKPTTGWQPYCVIDRQWIHRDCSSEFPISFAPALLHHYHWFQCKEDEVSKSVTVKVLFFKATACLVITATEQKYPESSYSQTNKYALMALTVNTSAFRIISYGCTLLYKLLVIAKHADVLQIKWLHKQSGVNRQKSNIWWL